MQILSNIHNILYPQAAFSWFVFTAFITTVEPTQVRCQSLWRAYETACIIWIIPKGKKLFAFVDAAYQNLGNQCQRPSKSAFGRLVLSTTRWGPHLETFHDGQAFHHRTLGLAIPLWTNMIYLYLSQVYYICTLYVRTLYHITYYVIILLYTT